MQGNQITVDGPDAERVVRLFDELVLVLESGQGLDAAKMARTIDMVARRPATVRGAERRGGAGGPTGARSGPTPPARSATPTPSPPHIITFGIGPAGTGKSYLAVAPGRPGPPEPPGQPHHPDPPGRRGRRAPRLPARRPHGQGRPLPAAPLRRPLRHGGARGRPAPPRPGHHRGGAARLHARAHPERLVHHPRRGAEHDARADEDVPHAHRLRLQVRRHRRRDPGRRRRRPLAGWSALEQILGGVEGIAFVHLTRRTSCATRSWPTSSTPTSTPRARGARRPSGPGEARQRWPLTSTPPTSRPTSRSTSTGGSRWRAPCSSRGVNGRAEVSLALRRRAVDRRAQPAVHGRSGSDRRAGLPDRRRAGARRAARPTSAAAARDPSRPRTPAPARRRRDLSGGGRAQRGRARGELRRRDGAARRARRCCTCSAGTTRPRTRPSGWRRASASCWPATTTPAPAAGGAPGRPGRGRDRRPPASGGSTGC